MNTSGATKTYNRVTTTSDKPKFYPSKTITNTTGYSNNKNKYNTTSSSSDNFLINIFLLVIFGIVFGIGYVFKLFYDVYKNRKTSGDVHTTELKETL